MGVRVANVRCATSPRRGVAQFGEAARASDAIQGVVTGLSGIVVSGSRGGVLQAS